MVTYLVINFFTSNHTTQETKHSIPFNAVFQLIHTLISVWIKTLFGFIKLSLRVPNFINMLALAAKKMISALSMFTLKVCPNHNAVNVTYCLRGWGTYTLGRITVLSLNGLPLLSFSSVR